MSEFARQVSAFVAIATPLIVIFYDAFVFFAFGVQATITDVIREWNMKSAWAEAIYVLGAVGLWLHFFRRWL